jgi:crossover junction endodeoxyribonuclease RuvC
MRILGVDPGSLHTGWGLVGGRADAPVLLDCGEIRLPASQPLPSRLHILTVEFTKLVGSLEPTDAAVEMPFQGVNARAALQLAHARGVLLAILAGAGIPVAEYTPATIKKSITGNGNAEKAQVQGMVERLVRSDLPSGGLDRSDALAVALCHMASAGRAAAILRYRRR